MATVDELPSVCCLMMTLPDEVDVTLMALDSLLYSGRENLTALVLVNGGDSPELRDSVKQQSEVQIIETPKNLGVAAGRALLAEQDAARQSKINVLVDNDVLLPVDYVDRLCELLMKNEKVGVVGASVLNYKYVLGRLPSRLRKKKGPLGVRSPRFTNAELRRYVEHDHSDATFYHLGTDPDWMEVYFPRMTLRGAYVRRKLLTPEAELLLARNPTARSRYKREGPEIIEVSSIAGCTQAFRRDLYDRIGGIRPEYSPYGFEDVDFCLRALRAGFRNCTMTHTFSLHGTDGRHQKRSTLPGLWLAKRNMVKSYTLLAHHHCPVSRRPFLLLNFVLNVGIDISAIVWTVYHRSAGLIIRLGAAIAGFIGAEFSLLGRKVTGKKPALHVHKGGATERGGESC